ncbi:MAG TPA: AraC family transcriptional regulator [Sphingopyxis sp.]|nr:AraC family transcriptional regulator [Sphingopyxis sp.]
MHHTGDAPSTAMPALSPGSGNRANRRALALPTRARRFPVAADRLQPVVVDRKIHDIVVEQDRAKPDTGVETYASLGDPRHFRVQGSANGASGYYEYCALDEGFFAVISDIIYSTPLPLSLAAENMVRVRIASDGDGEYAAADGDLLDLKGPSASIIIEPPGQAPAEAVSAGHHLAAEIYVHRDVLARLYARDDHELPAVLQAFITGHLQHTIARRLPLNPQLLRAMEDLRGCTLEGRSRRLVIRSKAIEILCHAIEALAQDENGDAPPEASKLAANGVLKAQRLLAENFVSPPSLDSLAHEVGMSRSGLCAAFRQIVGQSVFDYVGDLRMQQALAMLNRQDATIAEVAYAVGYGHPSSFSVAVQRRFGTTASELRRRGLPPA